MWNVGNTPRNLPRRPVASYDVQAQVRRDLGADSAARCVLLPEPERRTYRTATGEPVQLWVVLEPEGAREVVVFDEATSSFGLTRAGVFLGPVGRFREAVACVSLPDAR